MQPIEKVVKAIQIAHPDVKLAPDLPEFYTQGNVVILSNPDTDEWEILWWGFDGDAPTWDDLEPVWNEWESGALSRQKAVAISSIMAILAAFPGQVFKASPEKLAIYQRKQDLVNSWTGSNIPSKPQVEWDLDWSQRDEFAENGWVAVEAVGMRFRCSSAEDLWKTWTLNTALANYLDEQSEPLRTRAQTDVTEATDETAINAVVGKFGADLASLPYKFMTTIAPSLIGASGLIPA